MRKTLLVLAGLLAAGAARADVVYLKNGKSIEGKVSVAGDKVTVKIPGGSVSFPKSKVARIERKESAIGLYEKKCAALAPGDAGGRLALASWCRKQGLRGRGQKLLREVLELDADNAQARRLLGYVKHGGQWVTPEEKYRALGMVAFEGQWHKPEAVAEIKRARAEARTAEEERKKADVELALKKAEIEKLRAERDRAEAERRKLEAERARLEGERRRIERIFRRYPHFRVIGGNIYYFPDYPTCRKGIVIIRASQPPKKKKEAPEKQGGPKSGPAGQPKA